jgi:hypothetical protein
MLMDDSFEIDLGLRLGIDKKDEDLTQKLKDSLKDVEVIANNNLRLTKDNLTQYSEMKNVLQSISDLQKEITQQYENQKNLLKEQEQSFKIIGKEIKETNLEAIRQHTTPSKIMADREVREGRLTEEEAEALIDLESDTFNQIHTGKWGKDRQARSQSQLAKKLGIDKKDLSMMINKNTDTDSFVRAVFQQQNPGIPITEDTDLSGIRNLVDTHTSKVVKSGAGRSIARSILGSKTAGGGIVSGIRTLGSEAAMASANGAGGLLAGAGGLLGKAVPALGVLSAIEGAAAIYGQGQSNARAYGSNGFDMTGRELGAGIIDAIPGGNTVAKLFGYDTAQTKQTTANRLTMRRDVGKEYQSTAAEANRMGVDANTWSTMTKNFRLAGGDISALTTELGKLAETANTSGAPIKDLTDSFNALTTAAKTGSSVNSKTTGEAAQQLASAIGEDSRMERMFSSSEAAAKALGNSGTSNFAQVQLYNWAQQQYGSVPSDISPINISTWLTNEKGMDEQEVNSIAMNANLGMVEQLAGGNRTAQSVLMNKVYGTKDYSGLSAIQDVLSKGSDSQAQEANISNNVKLDLTDRAAKLLTLDKSSNTSQANAGYSTGNTAFRSGQTRSNS